MNILYISSKQGWGGVVSWMQRTAVGLEKKGHQVWIISHSDSRLTASTPPGLKIIPKNFGIDYNPVMILFLIRFIKRNKINLVVTNIQKEIIVGGIAARTCGISNIRRIGTEDDLNNRFRVKWHQKLFVDHNIVPCNDIKNKVFKKLNWLNPHQFTTIYNSRDPKIFLREEIIHQRRQWGLLENHFIIGTTSQLTTVKGIDKLIYVFKEILDKHKNCHLVITGEGPERKNLENLTNQLSIADKVIFPGFTSDPMKSDAAYDIAVSNSAFEGFPNTVVEYFAVGKPVVATKVNGIVELVEDGKNGLLIPSGDQKQLLQKILLLIENPDLRKRLSQNALATVKNAFSEDLMIDKLEQLFKKVINHEEDIILNNQ